MTICCFFHFPDALLNFNIFKNRQINFYQKSLKFSDFNDRHNDAQWKDLFYVKLSHLVFILLTVIEVYEQFRWENKKQHYRDINKGGAVKVNRPNNYVPQDNPTFFILTSTKDHNVRAFLTWSEHLKRRESVEISHGIQANAKKEGNSWKHNLVGINVILAARLQKWNSFDGGAFFESWHIQQWELSSSDIFHTSMHS